MAVRWLTAFIDRPAVDHQVAARFWSAVTGTTPSPARGDAGQFATLVPAGGDAHLRLQRIADGPGGCHLDVHVDDGDAAAARAVAAGATVVDRLDDVTVLRSPAGLPWCLVGHQGEHVRTAPVPLTPPAGGPRTLVDQLCIDVPAAGYEAECAFWAALTGWDHHRTGREELSYLVRPEGMPLRLLLQRLGPDDGRTVASAHLDLACDDVDAAVAAHVALGAEVVRRHPAWTAMADPSGYPYCLTSRDPDTGVLP